MFDQLSSLNTSRTNWRVKVRVTRMWPSGSKASNGNDGIKGYNLILLDDDNCHVHAYVYADNWKKLSGPIVEGGLYILSNFFTREALGSLKLVSSKIIINVSLATSVELIPEDDFMILFHKFEFVDLSELFSLANVIRAVEDFEKLSIIGTMFGDREIVKFRLTDGRHTHQVTVWGKLAVSTNSVFTEATEKPVIAILSSTKLKIFKNSVQISTLPSSRVYMNLDTDIVAAMRQRLYSDGYVAPERSLSTHTYSSTMATPIKTLSLKELSEKTSTEMLDVVEETSA
uniref:Replication protein A 70 kDa DNA-binding subunit B/D first OB fold domain-containing protein n=1 Tax=Daucus carota subsp. sativus TaxID=79200 RepID=A0A161ZNE1_DAUCS